LIGGLVRSTGAGMGCPDWPKCFGLWIPPTHISEVPQKYWNDPLSSINGQLIFNPIKTWTEYLNRLLGVVIGFSILVQFVLSIYGRKNSQSFLFSILALVLVIFQGWLGAKVVSTDLKPIIISVHLFVALLIAFSLLAALFTTRVKPDIASPYPAKRYSGIILWVTSIGLFIQFFLGTEVRSQVDVLFRSYDFGSRELYRDQLDIVFLVHRSASILIFILTFLQIILLGKQLPIKHFYQAVYPFLLTILLIFTGIVLAYLGFPAFVQPFHLFMGFSILCVQFWLILHSRFSVFASDGSAPKT